MNIEEYTIEMEKNLIPYKDYICPETIFGIYNSEEKNKIWKYGQAGVIKIGNAVERVINILLTTNGYRELDNKVVCKDGRNRRIDFLGIKNDEILILESKLKDNHDTGKSMDSIISDLVIKIEGVRNNYPNYKIIAILGFVLPNEKSRKYYDDSIAEINIINTEIKTLYGKEYSDFLGCDLIGLHKEWLKRK